MKQILSLAVLSLLGGLTSPPETITTVKAIHIGSEEKTSSTSVKMQKNGKKMVTMSLTETEYNHGRYEEYVKPLSSESNMMLAQALDLPFVIEKDGVVSLVQDHRKVVDTPMINLKNLGYEGKFQFGNPPQELQVVFDTGSSWAWVFSEKCGLENKMCPARSQQFLQSKSKDFKINEHNGQFLQYGKGAIFGNPSEDRGCFSKDPGTCINKLHFLTVTKGKDLQSLQGSGLIGLSPQPPKWHQIDDPMNDGVAGFIAQLQRNEDYQKEFDSIFSIYLSSDMKSPGDISFGGYDLDKFGKKGKELIWVDQSHNDQYWAANTHQVTYGGKHQLAENPQQVIFDNGMSHAMAPEKSFVQLVKALNDYGFKCQQSLPLWTCESNNKDKMSLGKLTDIEFDVVVNSKGETKKILMPPPAYMKFNESRNQWALFITPWQFFGMGGKKGEEYWVLGAQFLQNYYSIYDFKNNKIGLVESVTSQIIQE